MKIAGNERAKTTLVRVAGFQITSMATVLISVFRYFQKRLSQNSFRTSDTKRFGTRNAPNTNPTLTFAGALLTNESSEHTGMSSFQ